MKNVNKRNSHGDHGSKRRELAQHAHSRGSHAFTRTLASTQSQAPAQLLHNNVMESNFILKVPEGGGANRSTRRKKPDSLPANRHHIFEEKIQCLGRESNPHPPTLVISSFGPERAPHPTHWATDRRYLYSLSVCLFICLFFFTRALRKGLTFGVCLYVLCLCNVHDFFVFNVCDIWTGEKPWGDPVRVTTGQ